MVKRHLTMIFVLCSMVGFVAETVVAFDEADLKKLRSAGFGRKKCPKCDLSNLSSIEVGVNVPLPGADLRGANLTGVSFIRADLREANLTGANLTGADLSTGDLRGAKLDGAILCKTKMPWGEDNSGCQRKEDEALALDRAVTNAFIDTNPREEQRLARIYRGNPPRLPYGGLELLLPLEKIANEGGLLGMLWKGLSNPSSGTASDGQSYGDEGWEDEGWEDEAYTSNTPPSTRIDTNPTDPRDQTPREEQRGCLPSWENGWDCSSFPRWKGLSNSSSGTASDGQSYGDEGWEDEGWEDEAYSSNTPPSTRIDTNPTDARDAIPREAQGGSDALDDQRLVDAMKEALKQMEAERQSNTVAQEIERATPQRSDVDSPTTVVAPSNAHAYAIVVGIEQYRQHLPSVDFAAHDATIMAQYLEQRMGYPAEHVILLQNEFATHKDLEKYVETWLPNQVDANSSVFVYYSGHGAPNPTTGEAYLMPYDGDPAFLANTGYPLNRLYAQLSQLPAQDITVVLDTCFSGAGGRSVLAKGARPVVVQLADPVLSSDTLAVLTASTSEQISSTHMKQHHGLLTYYFLKGLQGEADGNGDGQVALEEVFEYVQPQVERVARRAYNTEQTPQLLGAPAVRQRPLVHLAPSGS